MRILALTLRGLLGMVASVAAAEEPPWREPGQIVDANYLKHGTLRYTAEGREIVGHNRTCFNNRPLYCQPQTDGVVLAGDRPFVRLIGRSYVFGGFSAAILRSGAGKWFHDYAEVESRYRCGRMLWRISDPSLPQVKITLETVPASDVAGFAVKLNATGLKPGDKLVWAFGGAVRQASPRERWDPVAWGNPFVHKIGDPRKPELSLGIVPDWCKGNRATIEGQFFRLSPAAGADYETLGRSNLAGKLFVADASASANPAGLAKKPAGNLPMVCGLLNLKPGQYELYWAIAAVPAKTAAERLPVSAPAEIFRNGVAYLESIERVRTETPDARLDAAVAAVCHPMDAACNRNPFVFQHGCMSFHIPFLGWRVISGSTALGWHDRVKGNAAYYIASQVKEDNVRTQPQADPQRRLCHEGPQSRFYGRGHISLSPAMYDTQSQFFDQTIRDWRWTGDQQLEKILRPALELHLEWARQCFDPDDDGLYESYINTLPTDSVWYNGGGSVEETAYAYYGHLAAAGMAAHAGDTAAAARHTARARKILMALQKLWLEDEGHFGLYVEQGGHHRVHSDAWLGSVFLPIDAGMTLPQQAARSLFFTEWGLERIHLPFGGQLCQPSNWVPSKWSVRDMFGGDMWQLALAYFQTGLGDDGWELLNGAMLESAYAGAMPGGFSQIGAGADFADCKDMFARAVVEGLFGFRPDYPNGVVFMWPAFPSSWPRASIRTPDYSFAYRQEGNIDRHRLMLTRPAQVEFRLPVRAEGIRRVSVDGTEIAERSIGGSHGWRADPGYGCTLLRLRVPKSHAIDVAIELTGRVPQNPAKWLEAAVGEEVRFETPRGRIPKLPYSPDMWPTSFLTDYRQTDSTISGHLADRPGWHRALAHVTVGELPQWQVNKLHVMDPKREAEMAAKTPREAPRDARWTCLDLAPQFNGDIRTIFKQKYLSPRPKTCSVRIGVDGYSAWTFPYWGLQPPEIDLADVKDTELRTPQNVCFRVTTADRNIAFTSLWDNWPRSVSVPVGRRAEAVWLLVCGSTNPMQTQIANAEVRFRYSDGKSEKLELTPPLNFWSLCPFGGVDYDYRSDAFCLPKQPPPMVRLGNNCRAMVLSWKLRPAVKLENVTLETLSQDVVIGLMGVSLMNAEK